MNFPSVGHGVARDKSLSVYSRCHLDQLSVSAQTTSRDTVSTENEGTSKSAQVTDIDSEQSDSKTDNDVPMKTWNSLPALIKSNVKTTGSPAATSPTIQEDSSSNNNNSSNGNQSRAFELAEIIDIIYSESKPDDPNADKLAAKTQTPVRRERKTRHRRTKTRSGQSKRTSYNVLPEASSRVHEEAGSIVEETRPVATNESMEMRYLEQWTTRGKTSFLVGSAPEFTGSWSLEVEGQKDIRTPRKSFMEDGGSSVQPMATGYFPRPAEGQSLASFLTSAQFSRAHDAELDRENAHFSICEAMIAAIEQVKCNRWQRRLLDDAADDESDEEINRLKQRIRLRRWQRQEEKCRSRGWSRDLLSDGRTDTTTTTDQSVSPLSTSSGSSYGSLLTDSSDLDEPNALKPRNGGTIAALADYLFSDADSRLSRHPTDSSLNESSVSAEGVALSLISRFSEKQLPRASELQWLVSEKDAPQRLLPMPKSWPVSPDETEAEDATTISLRGTTEWAPPRPQIIFTPHAPPVYV